jgi:hypothetical protein
MNTSKPPKVLNKVLAQTLESLVLSLDHRVRGHVETLFLLGMAIRVRVPGTRRVPDPTGTGMGTIFHPWVAPIPNPA